MSKKITFATGSSSAHQGRGYFKIYNSLWIFLLLIAGFTSGCQKDEFKDEITGVCPVVVSTDPEDKAVDVVLEKLISATFNTDMDPATINKTTFTIKQGSTLISGTVAPTGSAKTFTFDPDVDLLPFKEYTGTITTGAKDPLHTAMISNYVWTFTTVPELTVLANPVGSVAGGTVEGAGKFAQASAVTVKAIPLPGYFFVNWTETGGIVATTAIYPFAMAGNRTLIANFSPIPKFTLAVSATPAAGGTASGNIIVETGTSVTATATVNPGYTFVNWTEGNVEVSKALAYSFPLTANRTLVANFKVNQVSLGLSAQPTTGGTTTGAGTFDPGTSVTATATAASGYTFVNWTEGGAPVSTDAAYTFTIITNRTLVANFAAVIVEFTLDLSAQPTAGGTISGGGKYVTGTSVTATATVKAGYSFVNWTENNVPVSTNATYTFPLNNDRTLVAHFLLTPIPGQFVVALSSNPLLGGTTTGSGSYNPGTSVTVAATANQNFTFVNWTENGVEASKNASFTFLIASDRTLVANFSPIVPPSKFSVMVAANPALGGMVTGGGLFDPNMPVTVTATANAGYIFDNWTENNAQVSTSTNYTFTIVANRILVANFRLIPTNNPIIIDLGTAADFVILTKSGISTTGITSITGDIGVSPAAASSITGFPLMMDPLGTNSFALTTDGSVVGKVYAADYAAPTPDKMTQAISDMETAFTTIYGLTTPAPVVEQGAGNISGLTLPAGIYKWSTGVLIDPNTSVTLNGSATDVWVFQIAQNLTVSNSARVVLQGNAQAKNVYWVVTGQATLGTNADFSGIILSKTLISLNTGAKVKGLLLAQTAVTLNASTVTKP